MSIDPYLPTIDMPRVVSPPSVLICSRMNSAPSIAAAAYHGFGRRGFGARIARNANAAPIAKSTPIPMTFRVYTATESQVAAPAFVRRYNDANRSSTLTQQIAVSSNQTYRTRTFFGFVRTAAAKPYSMTGIST